MSIEVKLLSKSYKKQKALNQVSFTVSKGEIVGFLGPNGAGKSTLMKILTGYITPDEGQAIVNGFDIKNNIEALKSCVGYLPEHNPLYLDLYVKEYLLFNSNVYNVPKSRINEVIEQTGLTPESNKKIGQLSKGFRQRVGLANALLHNPDVLILDEPTTGLDPNQLVEIRELIKSVGKDKTVFLSTHIMQEVEAICDRVIIINKGEIVADNQLKELKANSLQIIEVEFDQSIEEALFENVHQLESFVNTNQNIWELTFSGDDDKRLIVFDLAQKNGLKTLQLNVKLKNLETTFRELTQS